MTPETLFPYDRFLVPPPLARRSDPETSHAAARSVGRGAETAIMDAFTVKPDWTASELQAQIPMHPPTVASALSRLGQPTKRGAPALLIDSRELRKSDRDCWQIVWVKA